MIDQCKNCTFLGDFEKCKTTPCSHHKTWYAETLRVKFGQRDQLSGTMNSMPSNGIGEHNG